MTEKFTHLYDVFVLWCKKSQYIFPFLHSSITEKKITMLASGPWVDTILSQIKNFFKKISISHSSTRLSFKMWFWLSQKEKKAKLIYVHHFKKKAVF